MTTGMAYSNSFTNDEVRNRILNVYAKFVSDVEPDRLSDWLVQEHVITIDQKQRIRHENLIASDRCRAILDHLFSIKHPRAFLVVRQALCKDNHYLVEEIDNQEPGPGIGEEQTVLHARIQELEKDLMLYRSVNTQLHENEDELKKLVDQLKSELRLDQLRYISDPATVLTIKTKAADEKQKAIWGLTILDNELFVVSERCTDIEVYDSITLSFSRRWNLKKLNDPADLRSCNKNKCLYILDYKGIRQSKEILRVDPKGKLLKKWAAGYSCGRLSVTDESNVILTDYETSKLIVYSPEGQLIREINISLDAGRSNCHLNHAIQLTNDLFVVSHGYDDVGGFGDDDDDDDDNGADDRQQVCLVDANGKLQKSFVGDRGSTIGKLSNPVHLSIARNGFIMVADRFNSRVILLDSDLKFKREILSKEKHGLRRPSRILLDESNGRLFVVDNEWNPEIRLFKDGRILIFDFK